MKPNDGNQSRLQEALGSKYHVLKWIGGGGMAQVFLARNRDTGGLFAVKVLAEQLCGEDAVVARFLQEARTSAALSGHPNIVSIFDVGQFDDTHYIIMQYVEGEELKAYLSHRGKLRPEEAARIVEQIADALVFAHSRKVVHRDLKPSNIKVQNTGRVVVLDFGIAKAGDAPRQLTAFGQRVGTPHYMSPEHFSTGDCDARSDLYSLGVVFFELLTGRRPFEGASIQEIESAHRTGRAPSPCDVDASIPERYGRMVLRLLEKRPEDRYQTAADLISDIRQATAAGLAEAAPAETTPAETEPETPAAAPSVEERAARPKRLFRAALVLAGALVVAATAGLLFRATWAGRQQDARLPGNLASKTTANDSVTNTAYKKFCDETGYPYPEPSLQEPNYFYANPQAPVRVMYKDAVAFAKWAGKRLPFASEWDKAHGGGAGGTSMAEWTSTPYTPSDADTAAFRKLAGSDPRGDWFVVKGDAPLPGLPSGSRLRGVAVGFRCVKDAVSQD